MKNSNIGGFVFWGKDLLNVEYAFELKKYVRIYKTNINLNGFLARMDETKGTCFI